MLCWDINKHNKMWRSISLPPLNSAVTPQLEDLQPTTDNEDEEPPILKEQIFELDNWQLHHKTRPRTIPRRFCGDRRRCPADFGVSVISHPASPILRVEGIQHRAPNRLFPTACSDSFNGRKLSARTAVIAVQRKVVVSGVGRIRSSIL